jgi:hypothetical protein
MTHLHYTADLGEAWVGSTTAPEQSRLFGIRTMLRTAAGALRESLAACRAYERLRRRGVAHDAAIREALGVGRAPAVPPPTAHPLCFVGRA